MEKYKSHFGSVLILGRSGWGKTWNVQQILKNWDHQNEDQIHYLEPDMYSRWAKWEVATESITQGNSILASFYKTVDTFIAEDIHTSFLWSSGTKTKFLQQIQKIAQHSNIIVTLDPFGVKVPKQWVNPKFWSKIIKLNVPSQIDRMKFCKNSPILSKLSTSQMAYLLDITKDVSFRSLQRISIFIQETFLDNTLKNQKVLTISQLRQAAMNIHSVYLPPGLFSNAQKWVCDPKLTRDDLAIMYQEDPFHFPYLIWNALPKFCYTNGVSMKRMICEYMKILKHMIQMDNFDMEFRITLFAQMHSYFHSGWFVREPIMFQIPNIRNKLSYSRVRTTLLKNIALETDTPPMFLLNRWKDDVSLREKTPKELRVKIK